MWRWWECHLANFGKFWSRYRIFILNVKLFCFVFLTIWGPGLEKVIFMYKCIKLVFDVYFLQVKRSPGPDARPQHRALFLRRRGLSAVSYLAKTGPRYSFAFIFGKKKQKKHTNLFQDFVIFCCSDKFVHNIPTFFGLPSETKYCRYDGG